MYVYINLHKCKNLSVSFFEYQKLSLQFSIWKHYSPLVFRKRGEIQFTFSQEIKCTDEEIENYEYLEFIINTEFFRYITKT